MSGDADMSDADKIRLKRLARLGTPAQSSPEGSSSQGQAQPSTSSSSPASNSTPASVAAPTPSSSSTTSEQPAKSIKIKPSSSPAAAPPAPSSTASAPPRPSQAPESFESWAQQSISFILHVTLNRNKAESTSWDLTYLKGLKRELEEEHVSPVESFDIADRLLIARLSIDPSDIDSIQDDPEALTVLAAMPQAQTVFEYLVKCWQRAMQVRLNLLSRKNLDQPEQERRLNALEGLRDLLISYAGFNMQDPSMFPQPTDKPLGAIELLPTILSATSASTSAATLLSPNQLQTFLTDLGRRFTSDEELPPIMEPLLKAIPAEILSKHLTMSDTQFRPRLQALLAMSENKGIAACFPKADNWSPNTHVAMFETQSLLGPLLRISCFPDRFPDVAKSWFPDPSTMGNANISTTVSTLQLSIKTHQQGLYALFNNIIRSSPDAREAVLQLFAKVLQMNVKRQGLQVDPRTVAGDGFMVNMQAVLLQLALPFIDAHYTKLDRVDVDYFRKAKRFDMMDETRVHADASAAREYEAQGPSDPTPPNFISEIFFMTAWAHHLGYMPVVNTFNRYSRSLHDLEDQIKELEADNSWQSSPEAQRVQAQLDQMKKFKGAREAQVLAIQTHLLDPNFVHWQSSYTNFLMTWLVKIVDPKGQHPRVPIEMPLPEETTQAFNMLPEWLFEDAIGFFNFLSRANPELLASQSLNDLLTFLVVFLSTPYLRNPYIKGKFVEILYYNTRRSRDNSQGALGDAINTNPLALKSLMPALMRIYCDIEMTGQHTQFYDKFNIRFYIAMIFRVIWVNPTHREALHKEAARVDRFVRFVNLLINDTTYLLDESLSTLAKINNLTKLKENPQAWAALDEEEKKDKVSQLRQAERMAKMDIGLCNETVRLLKIITAETQAPFVRPEIVDRLCAMLTFNLAVLSGPESQDLKVRDPQEYRWDPKNLLSDLLAIFVNLSGQDEFAAGLSREGRSYKPELFDRAERIARRVALKAEDELAVLRALVEKVERIKAEEAAEEELGEAPDEFLDPLTYTLMKDPVILPKAKQSIDRGSIAQHLLSDPRCPFTSTPLTLEECVPDVELKAQIDKFVAERKSQIAANKMEVDV